MQSTSARTVAAFAIVGVLAVAAIGAQSANQARDYDAEIRTAVASAKQAAGFEWQGALVRTCLQPPQISAENTSDTVPGYVTKPASAPARSTWYAEPAKVFDDFYFVGGKIHSAWALTTSEGIILIDTIFPYNSDELIVGGLKKLGLDPTTIKYVIVTHGHGDHIGGAEMLQKEFGAKVVMGGPDWDDVEKYPNRFKTMAPKREIVATDGMKITLGGKIRHPLADARSYPGHHLVHDDRSGSRQAREYRLLGRSRHQFHQQHSGSGNQEFPDLYRLAEEDRGKGG